MIYKYFVPFYVLSFYFVEVKHKIFNFDDVQYLLLLLFVLWGVIFKKLLPNLWSQRFIPIFSSKNFVILTFIFRSLIHFEVMILYNARSESNFILLLYEDIQLFLWLVLVSSFVENQLAIHMRVCFWILSFVLLI